MPQAIPTRERRQAMFLALAERYANDLAGFAREVCGLDSAQPEFLHLAIQPGARIAARVFGRPIDRELAALALHQMLCVPYSQVIVPVFHIAQAETGVWGELRRIIRQLDTRHPLLARSLTITTNDVRVRHRGTDLSPSFIRMVSTRRPENLYGIPPKGALWLMPDAGRVPDHAFQAVAASLRTADERWIITYEDAPRWFWREQEGAPPAFDARGFHLIDVANPVGKRWA